MKITKNMLDAVEGKLRESAPKEPLKDWMAYLPGDIAMDIVRLARLGLWGLEHAIPALQTMQCEADEDCPKCKALGAIPKEEHET